MRSTAALSALLALATASVTSASVISFDPDGAGPAPVAQVGSFDFLPGNLLLVPSGSSVAVYYQARLGALLDGAGKVIPTPGLNGPAGDPNSYEITAVFGFGATANSSSNTFQFANLGNTSGTYYSLYFDHAGNASDLAGTGFRDGSLIYSGDVPMAIGTLGVFPFASLPLDAFGGDNYAGVITPILTGGLTVSTETISEDSSFFVTATSSLLTSASASDPFAHIDPSGEFEIGPDGSTLIHLFSPGSFHGGTGEDILVESDGATSFQAVPEPASLSLLAFGAGALVRRRRK